MPEAVLVLNAGSSSLKLGLFETGPTPRPVLRGLVERMPEAPVFTARSASGEVLERHAFAETPEFEDVLSHALQWCEDHLGAERLVGVGHRVVHGGDRSGPAPVDDALMAELEQLAPLAPLHQPHNLAPIRALREMRPALSQVACFDTAFHRTMPDAATRFALPRALHDQGIRRYGFHGLSYDWLARRLAGTDPALAGGRVVLAHLGSGASLCALKAGVSVDTTMGFTALDGLMMGTRCGALDPGVVLHLIRQGRGADEVEALLSRRSGLMGVSGLSADMRELLSSPAPEAAEAVALFVRRICAGIGTMAMAMGGLDGVVFSAGIGQHAAPVRAGVAEGLGWLGARLDADANAVHAADIAAPDSRIALRVMPTDEEAMIAAQTLVLI